MTYTPTCTPAEARKYLRIAAPTLNRYSRLFANYLSPTIYGHHRRYTQADLTVLNQVRRLSNQNVKLKDIPKFLVPPTEMTEQERSMDGITLEQSFNDLKDEFRLFTEIIQDHDQLYNKVLKVPKQTSDAIARVLKRLQICEQKIDQEARFLVYYKRDFERLSSRVTELEDKKSRGWFGR